MTNINLAKHITDLTKWESIKISTGLISPHLIITMERYVNKANHTVYAKRSEIIDKSEDSEKSDIQLASLISEMKAELDEHERTTLKRYDAIKHRENLPFTDKNWNNERASDKTKDILRVAKRRGEKLARDLKAMNHDKIIKDDVKYIRADKVEPLILWALEAKKLISLLPEKPEYKVTYKTLSAEIKTVQNLIEEDN